MPITALYAGVLAVVFIALSFYVISGRYNLKVSLGDAGHADLAKRIRVHANFAEYTPLGLILLAVAEQSKSSLYLLHTIGMLLLAGRLLHAYGLSQTPTNRACRGLGMVATFTSLAIGAVTCLMIGLRL